MKGIPSVSDEVSVVCDMCGFRTTVTNDSIYEYYDAFRGRLLCPACSAPLRTESKAVEQVQENINK